MRIKKRSAGTEVALEEAEAGLLAHVMTDLLTLLGEPDAGGDDPLEALVGLRGQDPVRPADPALTRLLPDAYGEDPDASMEFRRYTEDDLRAGKRAHARALLASLPRGAATVVLDRDQVDAWLGALNDVRLVLGTRLGVQQDVEPQDPDGQALAVYHWLGWAQDSLLSAISPR